MIGRIDPIVFLCLALWPLLPVGLGLLVQARAQRHAAMMKNGLQCGVCLGLGLLCFHERPHQGRACGNLPPRVAFPTLPTLPPLPERVDPDAWLATLDQKMYLRHVGRDGCVDVDLAMYYLGPQLAKRAVLLQVRAHSRHFAVWHEDYIVKRVPIKGLVGQEMALDDYLKYIQQEALAAPRRSSPRSSRKVRRLSLWGEKV